MPLTYYTKHIFLCTNKKEMNKTCCANSGGEPFFEYFKSRLLALDLHGPNKIRISKSGCLGRCSEGPCIVIYPEAVWYTYHSYADLDEIIEKHLIQQKIVPNLLLTDISG
jgi:(2Fe-2S) ferredoxin